MVGGTGVPVRRVLEDHRQGVRPLEEQFDEREHAWRVGIVRMDGRPEVRLAAEDAVDVHDAGVGRERLVRGDGVGAKGLAGQDPVDDVEAVADVARLEEVRTADDVAEQARIPLVAELELGDDRQVDLELPEPAQRRVAEIPGPAHG